MTISRFKRLEEDSRARRNKVASMISQAAYFISTYRDGCDLVLVAAQNNMHITIGMRSPMTGERIIRLGHFSGEDSINTIRETIEAAVRQPSG